MATILIEPVQVYTKGGFPVKIIGLSPTDHDCIVGEITLPATGARRQTWDLNGTARDSVDGCNLNMRDEELTEIAELAKKLGATT